VAKQGWYPDPGGEPGMYRYFDGAAWSEALSPTPLPGPPGQYAGALIERCGLKGQSVGGARVSEKHAGFIVNTGGATAADVRALIALVQTVVENETGVFLEPEIRFV